MFVGSSHVGNGVDESGYHPPAGVLAFPGMSSEVALAAYKNHGHLWSQLRVLIVEVDEFTLLSDPLRITNGDPSEMTGRLRLNSWKLPASEIVSVRPWWLLRNLALGRGLVPLDERVRFTTSGVLLSALDFEAVLPSIGPTPSAPGKEARFSAKLAARRVNYLRSFKIHSPQSSIDALVELALLAHENEQQIVLITFPTHSTYNQARPAVWDTAIEEAVSQVREAVPASTIHHWDLRNHPALRDERFYANQDHLNEQGAKTLTRLLQEPIRQLLN